MNAQMYRACADSLLFALRLPTALDLPAAPELQRRAIASLDNMALVGRGLGIPEDELAEARYALVAFIDEQVLKSTWAGRTEWMSQPLQLLFYREFTAGENFFTRLRSLLQSGARPLSLEVYYLCLALGFRGAFGLSGQASALGSYVDAARRDITKRLPSAQKFGPNAVPSDQLGADRKSNALLIAVIAGSVCLVLLVLFGLHYELRSELRQALSALPGGATLPKP